MHVVSATQYVSKTANHRYSMVRYTIYLLVLIILTNFMAIQEEITYIYTICHMPYTGYLYNASERKELTTERQILPSVSQAVK